MARPAQRGTTERVLDLELEGRAEAGMGFARQVVLEQAVFAELSALARTTPGRSPANPGFRVLDHARGPA
jgi:hypothetical protein